jgi:hypothetical protein
VNFLKGKIAVEKITLQMTPMNQIIGRRQIKLLIGLPQIDYYYFENFFPSYSLKIGTDIWKEFTFFLFFSALGFELRAYALNHSASPFFVMGFLEIGS